MRRLPLVFAAVLLFAAAGCGWPMFHYGPEHGGFNPLERRIGPSNVSKLIERWSAGTGNAVRSSPAVVNGVVYVTSENDTLYTFDATSGSPLWNGPLGTVLGWSSPAVVDGVVYVGSGDHRLYAFDATGSSAHCTGVSGEDMHAALDRADRGVSRIVAERGARRRIRQLVRQQAVRVRPRRGAAGTAPVCPRRGRAPPCGPPRLAARSRWNPQPWRTASSMSARRMTRSTHSTRLGVARTASGSRLTEPVCRSGRQRPVPVRRRWRTESCTSAPSAALPVSKVASSHSTRPDGRGAPARPRSARRCGARRPAVEPSQRRPSRMEWCSRAVAAQTIPTTSPRSMPRGGRTARAARGSAHRCGTRPPAAPSSRPRGGERCRLRRLG